MNVDTNIPSLVVPKVPDSEQFIPTDLYTKTCGECQHSFSASHASKVYCNTCTERRDKTFRKEYRKRRLNQVKLARKLETKLGAPLPNSPLEGWERGILDDLANPFVNLGIPELCAKWGITPKDYYDFKDRFKHFNRDIEALTESYKVQLPAFFLKALVDNAKKGSDTAIKMGLEITNQYAPKAPTPAPKSSLEGMSEEDKERRLSQLLKKVKS